MAHPAPHEREIDQLFDLELPQFTSARDALARSLAKGGERELSQQVKALKRPTVPAWAVNQLARRERAEMDGLRDIDAELRGAQNAAMKGRAVGDTLRTLSVRRREQVSRLVKLASEILTRAGHAPSPDHLREIDQTLSAAATDAALAELVAAGRLQRPAEPSSLASMFAPAGHATAPTAVPTGAPAREHGTKSAKPAASRDAGDKQVAAERAREETAREERARLAEERERQRQKDQERREAEKLTRAAEQAARESDRLENEAADLESRAKQARQRASAAAKAAEDARKQAREATERANRM